MSNTIKFYKIPAPLILMDMGNNGQVIISDGIAFHPSAPVVTDELEEVACQDFALDSFLDNAQNDPVKLVFHHTEFAPLKAIVKEKMEDFQ